MVKIRSCKKCGMLGSKYSISGIKSLCAKCTYSTSIKKDVLENIVSAPAKLINRVMKRILFRW